jgi:hypothetical protein
MYARFKPRTSVELYARTSLDLDPAQRHPISEIASGARRLRVSTLLPCNVSRYDRLVTVGADFGPEREDAR